MSQLNPVVDRPFVSLEDLAYADVTPTTHACIKQDVEDFCVDEELGFELSGEGEHLYVQVRKRELSTPDVARRFSEATGTALSRIGYAGMKDRRGLCSQWFSLQLPPEQERKVQQAEAVDLEILATGRNHRKIRVGSHKRNHFSIILRDCSGAQAEFEQRLQQIQLTGAPNYFGVQRFGKGLSNLTQLRQIIRQDMQIGSGSGETAGFEGRRLKRSMLFSAARAYLFNQLLSARLEQQNWADYVAGDVLNLDGTSRYFLLDSEQQSDADQLGRISERLQSFDIHITGPLAGKVGSKDKYVSSGAAADIEYAVLETESDLMTFLIRGGLQAARRALRFRPQDLKWQWQDSTTLNLQFSLGGGQYATSLLREICNFEQVT